MWKFIEYEWIEVNAYESWNNLKEYVKKVLDHPESIERSTSRQVLARRPGDLTEDKVLDIFKRNAQSPWGWLENQDKFYFYKIDLPPDCVEKGHVLPLLPGSYT